MVKRTNRYCSRRHSESNLNLAVRLAIRQLSDGIGVDEAIQFSAKYHNVTCSAVEIELHKLGHGFLRQIPKATILAK